MCSCPYIPGNQKNKPVSRYIVYCLVGASARKKIKKQKSTEKEWGLKDDQGRLFWKVAFELKPGMGDLRGCVGILEDSAR